jgi:hypothetical protein
MGKQVPMNVAAAVNHTVASIAYLNRDISFITGTEATFVGYIEFILGVPLPTLYGEMKVKH